MVEVVPNVLPGQLTIVIVGMMSLSNLLVQSGVEVSQDPSSVCRPMVHHGNDKTEVNEREHADDAPKSLHWGEEIHTSRSQVREGAQEQ